MNIIQDSSGPMLEKVPTGAHEFYVRNDLTLYICATMSKSHLKLHWIFEHFIIPSVDKLYRDADFTSQQKPQLLLWLTGTIMMFVLT